MFTACQIQSECDGALHLKGARNQKPRISGVIGEAVTTKKQPPCRLAAEVTTNEHCHQSASHDQAAHTRKDTSDEHS